MLLVIDRKDTTVRYTTGVLRIERKDEPLQNVPIRLLERVVVYGNPLVESAVWRALADMNVPTLFIDVRGKQHVSMLSAGLATTLPLRRLQYRCADNAATQLVMARYCIEQKLQSYALPLQTLTHDYGLATVQLECFQVQIAQTLLKLPHAETLSSLNGLEGQVAASWFALLAEALKTWQFNGRNRQPPRDPINALLSLGYTLMETEMRHALIVLGFDPALGFLHQAYPARDSLALDLLETFRATVDNFVLKWLLQTPLDKSSFYYRDTEGCRLSKTSRPAFYAAWAHLRQQCPRPFAPNQSQAEWGEATLTEIATGQAMRLRDQLKRTMAVSST